MSSLDQRTREIPRAVPTSKPTPVSPTNDGNWEHIDMFDLSLENLLISNSAYIELKVKKNSALSSWLW